MKIVGANVLITAPGRNYVTLKITTDDGLVGWSEYNETFGGLGVSAVIDGLIPLVIGKDPRAWEAIVTLLYAVRRQAAGGVVQPAQQPGDGRQRGVGLAPVRIGRHGDLAIDEHEALASVLVDADWHRGALESGVPHRP